MQDESINRCASISNSFLNFIHLFNIIFQKPRRCLCKQKKIIIFSDLSVLQRSVESGATLITAHVRTIINSLNFFE